MPCFENARVPYLNCLSLRKPTLNVTLLTTSFYFLSLYVSLSRISRHRRARARAGTPSGSDTEPSTPMNTLRARRLKQMRDEERRKESNDQPSEVNPDRGGQRSPMRGRLQRNQSTASSRDDEESDEEEGDDGEDKDNKPIDEVKYADELLTTSQPEHVFPLKLLPTRRSVETLTQPLLVLPEGGPSVHVPFVSRKGVSNPLTEVDLMQGNSTMLNNASGESERLITQNDGKLRGSGEDLDDQTMAMMHAGDSRVSGLYVRESPVWASKLLGSTESVTESLRDSVDHNMYLARVTQRTLRDLESNLSDLEVRRSWQSQLKNDAETSAAGAAGGRRGRGRGRQQQEDAAVEEVEAAETISDRSAASSRLLRQVSTGPILRVIDDPVDDDTTIVSIPEQSKAFGGQLGNWGPEATIKERLGPLNTGDRRTGSRSILRLHIHQLSLKDFPLISMEEKKFNDMKSAYAVYRSLFEHQTLPYLTTRVNTVLEELSRLVNLSEGGGEPLDEEEMLLLKSLYFDLTESLPLLRELRSSMDTLTAKLFEDWKEIKDIRRGADGFHGTKANLVVKKMEVSIGRGVGEGKDGDDGDVDGSGAARSWAELQGRLGARFTELLNKVQSLLLEADLEAVRNLRSDTSSELDLAEEAAKAMMKGQRAGRSPVRPPRGGRGGAGDDGEEMASMTRSLSGRAVTSAGSKAEELRQKYVKAKNHLIPVGSQIENTKTVYPDYVLRLSEDGEATPQSQIDNDPEESGRRNTMHRTQFKCVIVVNDRVITETKECTVNHSTLTVDFHQYFEFRVLHQPDTIFVDVYAMTTGLFGFRTSVKVRSIPVPFPGQNTGAQRGGSGYSKKLSPSAHMFTPVAGWRTFTSTCALFGDLKIQGVSSSGALLVAAEYDLVSSENASSNDAAHRYDGVDETNLALLPPRGESAAGAQWGSRFSMGGGLSSAQLLPTLMTMDPNDPRNTMLSSSRFDSLSSFENRSLFLMQGNEVAVPFKEGLESYNNYLSFKMGPRLQLLQLREMKPHLFSEPIPNTDDEVSKSALYKQILYTNFPDHLTGLDKEEDAEDEAIKTEIGSVTKIRNFLQKVRNSNIAQSRRKTKKKLMTSATVAETVYFVAPEEPDLADLIPIMKRALKPAAQPRTAMSMHVDKCNLLVQVVAARNIPLRTEKDEELEMVNKPGSPRKSKKNRRSRSSSKGVTGAGSDSEGGLSGGETSGGEDAVEVDEALLDEEKLSLRKRAQTCVEVRFQENRESTVRMSGSAPLWKQSIGLPFRAPGDDYSPSALSQVRDDVYFTLFDEVDEDDAHRGGRLEGDSTTRTERRYLGSFTIPFSTIYSLGRIEGTFRLHTPMFNFGYVRAGTLAEKKEDGNPTDLFGHTAENDPLSEEAAFVREPTAVESVLIRIGLLQPQKRLVQEFGQYIHPKTVEQLEYFASGDGSTYIKILATMDPLLATIPKLPGDVPISSLYHDDRNYGPYAQNWLRSLADVSQATKDRPYKCFGMNSEGLQTLLCRYLSPLEPPDGYTTMRSVVHLVSMLPYLSDAQTFQETSIDFWCSSKQAWEVGAGDEEEHGTILFNYLYFLSLNGNLLGANMDKRERRRNADSLRNKQGGYPDDDAIRDESVFLVLGEAYPEGDAVYVMVRDRNMASKDPFAPRNFVLINPINGFVYSAMDPSCPVRNIACLVTPYNLWANVQTSGKPHDISYDVLNVDKWRPFFGKRLPPPSGGMHSIQEEITYAPTMTRTCADIENAVTAGIRNGIRRWRSKRARSTTTFHPDGCSIAADMLPLLESWRKTGQANLGGSGEESDLDGLMEEAERKMAPILRTRTFHGCPINYSFTDVDDIMNKVKALGVHETRHPEVQFVVAAKAFPLYNEVVSLWIFLGVLEATGV